MAFDYNGLWKILKKRKMKKKDLRIAVDIPSLTLAKLRKNEIVSMDVLGGVCEALQYDIGDIADYVSEK